MEGREAEEVIWKRKDSSGTREGEAGRKGTKEAKARLSFRIYLVELIAGRRYEFNASFSYVPYNIWTL